MSGASREATSTLESNFLAVACATPFSRMADRLPSTCVNMSIDTACIEIFMNAPRGVLQRTRILHLMACGQPSQGDRAKRDPRNIAALRAGKKQFTAWPRRALGETIGAT